MYDFYCIILVTYIHTIFVAKMKWIYSLDEIIKYSASTSKLYFMH